MRHRVMNDGVMRGVWHVVVRVLRVSAIGRCNEADRHAVGHPRMRVRHYHVMRRRARQMSRGHVLHVLLWRCIRRGIIQVLLRLQKRL